MPDTYTYTASRNIAKPASGNSGAGYVATWDANLDLIDSFGAIGALAVAAREVPSTSLNVRVSAGSFRKADGSIVAYAGTSSQAVTTATTNYVFLTDAGVLTVNTSGFPSNCVRLATVVAAATTITSVADAGVFLAVVGVGSPTIAAGTGAGTSPTVTVTGNDRAGLISVATGTAPAASAVVATITSSTASGAAPKAVILTPAGPNAATLSGNGAVYLDSASTTAAHFVLKVGSSALAASTTYLWHYQVVP